MRLHLAIVAASAALLLSGCAGPTPAASDTPSSEVPSIAGE